MYFDLQHAEANFSKIQNQESSLNFIKCYFQYLTLLINEPKCSTFFFELGTREISSSKVRQNRANQHKDYVIVSLDNK